MRRIAMILGTLVASATPSASSRRLMNTAASPWARMRAKLRATVSAGRKMPRRCASTMAATVSVKDAPRVAVEGRPDGRRRRVAGEQMD